MKKKLLILGTITMLTSAYNAQNSVVYVGDGGKFFVSGSALVYSGGNWKVDSDKEKTVENKGNIIIVGDYKRGSTANAAQDGKEFVNVYTDTNNYGQVKLLNATGTSDARMTIQRPAASSNYFGASYGMSFPYKDDVSYLMKSFGLQESAFRGDCTVGADCANRYKMSLTKWNNVSSHHDAVPTASQFKPGDHYNLNLRESNMKAVMVGTISYKGTPDGRVYTQSVTNRTIYGLTKEAFSGLTYDQWKKRLNPYKEFYESYLGYVSTTSKIYAKNVFRFGNPYTSNLDLSAFDGADAWLKIVNNGGSRTIKQAHDAQLIRNFAVSKVMPDYDYNWRPIAGSVEDNGKYFIAKYDGTQWVGSAEALLVRPMEAFFLDFPTLNTRNLGSTIVELEVNFTDKHKTFDHVPSAKSTTSIGLTASLLNFENNLSGMMMARDISYNNIQKYNLHQLEIVLSKDSAVQASPVYIVGTNYNKESGSVSTSAEKIFVYGVKDGAVAYDSQKNFNEFNTDTYIGKPLGIGFGNLQEGQTYQLRFALYEDSIFNKVDAFKNGVFYLKDNISNKVSQINPNEVVSFVANANVAKRFEVYWKQAPQVTTTKPVETKVEQSTTTVTNQSTVIYKDEGLNKVRFENISNTVKVEVFNVAGILISSKSGVSTNNDYTLNLGSEGMYVVRVVYQNGEVRTLKVVNN